MKHEWFKNFDFETLRKKEMKALFIPNDKDENYVRNDR